MPEIHVPEPLNPGILRSVRLELGASQSRFAEAIRKAGDAIGEPNKCTKRLVQLWEGGDRIRLRTHYQRALEHVTGLPFAALCEHRPVAYATLPRRLDRIIRELTALRQDLDNLE